MSNTPLQISWNTFSAGMNDQKYQGQEGRYYQGVNVDTRRYDIRPNSKNKLIETYDEDISGIFNASLVGGSYNVVWTEDGKVYRDDELRHTFTEGIRGNQIGTLKVGGEQRLYYFNDTIPSVTPKYIHRSTSAVGSFDDEYLTYDSTEGNDTIVPPSGMRVVNESDRIIFSHYNKVFQLDNAEIVTELISFASNENVVGITQFLGEYKIYTSAGFTDGAIYTWDGSSSEYNLSVKLKGMYIGSVANKGAYDYMIADNEFYRVSGVQYQKLFNRNMGKIIGVFENDVYLNNAIDGTEVISTFGDEPGYTESMTPAYVVDTDDLGEDVSIDDMAYDGGDVYYAVGNKLYQIGGGGSFTNFESYIESLAFVGDSIEYRKQLEEIRIKFSGATDDCKIRVSLELDDSNTWITVWEGKNGDIEGDNYGLKIPKSAFQNEIGNFNIVRIRLSFIQNGTDRARFYGIDLLGTQNIGQ